MPARSLLLALALPCASLQAEIYRWVDEQGKVHFTDQPPHSVEVEKVTVEINSYTSPTISQRVAGDQRDVQPVSDPGKVVMYGTAWCGYCKKARAYFSAQGIPFEEYDVEKNASAQREFKRLGGRGVPVILVGDKRMNGFSVKTFERLYGRS